MTVVIWQFAFMWQKGHSKKIPQFNSILTGFSWARRVSFLSPTMSLECYCLSWHVPKVPNFLRGRRNNLGLWMVNNSSFRITTMTRCVRQTQMWLLGRLNVGLNSPGFDRLKIVKKTFSIARPLLGSERVVTLCKILGWGWVADILRP